MLSECELCDRIIVLVMQDSAIPVNTDTGTCFCVVFHRIKMRVEGVQHHQSAH